MNPMNPELIPLKPSQNLDRIVDAMVDMEVSRSDIGTWAQAIADLRDCVRDLATIVRHNEKQDSDYVFIDNKPIHKQFIRQLLEKAADPNWLEQIHAELKDVNANLNTLTMAVHHS